LWPMPDRHIHGRAHMYLMPRGTLVRLLHPLNPPTLHAASIALNLYATRCFILSHTLQNAFAHTVRPVILPVILPSDSLVPWALPTSLAPLAGVELSRPLLQLTSVTLAPETGFRVQRQGKAS
jgi:hypothetical protein